MYDDGLTRTKSLHFLPKISGQRLPLILLLGLTTNRICMFMMLSLTARGRLL